MRSVKTYGLYIIVLLAVVTFSCLEDRGYTDIINAVNSNQIILSWYGADGTPNNKTVALPPGEVVSNYKLTLSATSSHKINKDVTLSVGINPNTIGEVNQSITKESDKFLLLPADAYKIPSASATVTADTTEVPFIVTFYQDKIDKSKNYMLPLQIQNQEGAIVASNAGTAKLTFIGNPIAGGYTQQWIRYNNATGTGTPAFDQTFDAVFAPTDATTIEVESGTGVIYILTFKNSGGTLSNFKVSFDPKSVTDAAITITDGPTIIQADAAAGKYEFNFGYLNSTGAARVIKDKFTKK
jgi:hypothetical protein